MGVAAVVNFLNIRNAFSISYQQNTSPSIFVPACSSDPFFTMLQHLPGLLKVFSVSNLYRCNLKKEICFIFFGLL